MPRYIDAEGLNLYDDLFMSEDTINKSGVYVRYKAIENLIKNAPTADVQEVKHAHWIFETTMHHEWMTCSECLTIQTPTGVFSYCPNCGAKMGGGNK